MLNKLCKNNLIKSLLAGIRVYISHLKSSSHYYKNKITKITKTHTYTPVIYLVLYKNVFIEGLTIVKINRSILRITKSRADINSD